MALSRPQIAAISVAGSVAFLAVVAWIFTVIVGGVAMNPLAGKSLYVYPESQAAVAARSATGTDAAIFTRIAETPTAVWLTPERHDVDSVAGFVDGIERDAGITASLPVFVVYGIPDRDCSNQSAGGTTQDGYAPWVQAIAEGIGDRPTVVILEPDSLALTVQCGGMDGRIDLIAQAIDALESETTWVYLDGGHSTWLPAEQQAALLNDAGIDRVTGFASNVSNFNSTEAEVTYANAVSALTGQSHYVIDVGRNGNGGNGVWCNPTGQALGADPEIVEGSAVHDANLWIKNPGESDGACNGGPAAGTWWPAGARALGTN